MYNKLKIFYPLVYFMFIANMLHAQDQKIKGIVHSFDSIPLIGAEISVKSTKESVFTDSLGNFMLFCNPNDKIKIMADGFSKEVVKINSKVKIVAVNLRLKTMSKNTLTKNYIEEEQKYAIGYGYVSEQDKSNASANLNANDATFVRYSNMYDLIRGQFAGVEVIENRGVVIRGTSNINDSYGNSFALIVVDGVISESDILDSLSPTIVKSVSVIKDGTTNIYGSRGANGVLLIETKKGGDEL